MRDSPSSCTQPSESPEFEYKELCLFCGQVAKYVNKKKKHGNDVFPVRTSDFETNFGKICEERNDKWGRLVACRLALVIDLYCC